jgi:NTF2-related export protein 1/2
VQAATSFVQLYYAAIDSATRAADVPKFYRDYSVVSWNGNSISGAEGVAKLLKDQPATTHTVQSFDCHPVPSACRSAEASFK